MIVTVVRVGAPGEGKDCDRGGVERELQPYLECFSSKRTEI